MSSQKTALYVSYVWPEPKSSAAGVRSLQIIELLKKQGFDVGVVSSCKQNSYKDALHEYGVWTKSWPLNRSEVDEEIKNLKPTLVIFDRFVSEEQFSFRFKRYSPESVLILDMQDFHALRRARHKQVKKLNNQWEFALQKTEYHEEDVIRELGSILRCDQTLVISKFEYDLLIDEFEVDPKKLSYFPYQYPDQTQQNDPSFDEREGFCMIGNYRHAPNLDSVKWTLNSLWPKFLDLCKKQDRPLPVLYLYGAYTPDEVVSLASKVKNVKMMGMADDVQSVMRKHRVLWAPLRFGAGLKGKIVEAMRSKCAFVTTSIGAEGLLEEAACNNESDFFERALQCYCDQKFWELETQRALNFFNKNQVGQEIDFESLKTQRDWVSKILRNQISEAEYYFSKWIELKETSIALTKAEVIKLLGLEPLLGEGGFYKQTYKSPLKFAGPNGERSLMTSIYYLLGKGEVSLPHILKSDEIYYYQMGQPLELKLTSPDGLVEEIVLGADIKSGQVLQTVVKAGYSQTSRLLGSLGGPDWSLVGTAVSPGFEFEDWVEG